jgi:cytochrome o ubiquinol oxidase subunit 2
MDRNTKRLLFLLLFTGAILLLFLLMQPLQILHYQPFIAVLFPSGEIGVAERNLLLIIQALMLLIVIPVYILTFYFSWKYRAGAPDERYEPDLIDNTFAEIIWWSLPFVMTLVIGVITWVKTYELDPYKPITSASQKKELVIQAVALQWKWLFIYPEEKIASLNFLQIPVDRPIHFEVTADAPMNSLWIPKLGGQIYAMPAMKTELYLIANEKGDFRGSSANISGEGFAGMHFIARATSDEDYASWVSEAKQAPNQLDKALYLELAKPSKNEPEKLFALHEDNLFHTILMKYMAP